MEKISIIVPVYKVEKYLDRCVESIVNQTYKNLEIILVDDGSPDNCPQICDEWAKKDSRIKVIHKENGGVSSARNAGLDLATGDYIGFVDADDYIDDDMFEFLFHNIVEYDADISRCSLRLIENGESIVCTEDTGIKIYNSQEALEDCKYSGWIRGVIWNKLYKKSFVDNIRFDENLKILEDTTFNYFVLKKVNKVIYNNEPKYNYRIYGNQATLKSDFNYESYKAMKKIINDDDCPTSLYYKFFTYATMTLSDIVNNDFDYDFEIIRQDILKNKKKIKTAVRNFNDKRGIFKLIVLSMSSKLYKLLSKSSI